MALELKTADARFELLSGRLPLAESVLSAAAAELQSGCTGGLPIILAVDTSLGSMVAVSRAGKVWQCVSDDKMGHAELVGEMISAALAAADCVPSDIDAVVMGVGPGSFTGLRVGMAAATAFATALQKPLLPIISHEASALSYFYETTAGGSPAESSIEGVGGSAVAPAANDAVDFCQIVAEPAEGAGADAAAARVSDEPDTVRIVQDARRKELFVTEYTKFCAADAADVAATPGAPGATAAIPGQGCGARRLPVERKASAVIKRDSFTAAVVDYSPERISGSALIAAALLRLAQNQGFAPKSPVYLRDPDVRKPAAVKTIFS